MDKLKMQTVNKVDENVERIAALFPNCVTESIGADGKPTKVVDFDLLRQELSSFAVEGGEERYQFTWADKKKSILLANSSISKTLRPCREESVNFDTTKNLYIEGDNLDVLKLLQETYMGKIDVIYIDPPYNTGRNLIYKNKFHIDLDDYLELSEQVDDEHNMLVENNEANGRFHTDWLNMIYQRLRIAKGLLSNSGIIMVTMDDSEIFNLGKVMDEIFGEVNRLGLITIVHNPRGRNDDAFIASMHEYCLVYAADYSSAKINDFKLSESDLKQYKQKDEISDFAEVSFIRTGNNSLRVERPNLYYEIYYNPNTDVLGLTRTSDEDICLLPINGKDEERTWRWGKETFLEQKDTELFVKKINGEYRIFKKRRLTDEVGKKPKSIWIDSKYDASSNGIMLLQKLFDGKNPFSNPKSIYAVEDCLRITCNSKSSIIMDFFSGSSTTAHAVMNLNAEDNGNRKFIMVQVPEVIGERFEAYRMGYRTIPEIAKERIRRAGRKIADENRMTAPHLDIGFRVLKVDSSNMKPVFYNPSDVSQDLISQFEDNIKDDRTPEDLLFQVMLDMGVDLSSTITVETLGGKKVFTVGGDNLICCFDKDITKDAVTEIAKRKPLYSVFRDSSFGRDDVMVSFDQIFETYSPTTVRKVI